MRPLRLMAVLAHPDDESLGFGGALARCFEDGVGTYLVTATMGQRGRFHGRPQTDPEHPGAERLAVIREAELLAAAEALGVQELSLLGYMDGALDQVDAREATERIAMHIRHARPQVVLTFAPDGAYGHPDHIAISQLTTAAIVRAADPSFAPAGSESIKPHAVSKLYYRVSPAAWWAAYEAAMKKLTITVDDVAREAGPWPDWQITTVIDTRAQWPTVWRAVSCHESQIGSYDKLRDLPPEQHEALWGQQHFYRAFSTVNGGRAQETDLFEGLRG